MRQIRLHILMLLMAVLLTACAGSTTSDSNKSSGRTLRETVELISETSSYEYVPFRSPQEMANQVDVAFVGRVVSLEPGLVEDGYDGRGIVIMGVAIDENWGKATPPPSPVYLTFPRPKNVSIAEYDGLANARVAIFAYHNTQKMLIGEGDPGAPTYSPFPQGFMVVTSNGDLLSIWAERSEGTNGPWAAIDTLTELESAITR